jgi:hypothetical protein
MGSATLQTVQEPILVLRFAGCISRWRLSQTSALARCARTELVECDRLVSREGAFDQAQRGDRVGGEVERGVRCRARGGTHVAHAVAAASHATSVSTHTAEEWGDVCCPVACLAHYAVGGNRCGWGCY